MPASNEKKPVWPMPKFHFEVDLGAELKGGTFQETSGLEEETQVIEYPKSDSPLQPAAGTPSLTKFGNITMKRGVFVSSNAFWIWMDAVKMNTIKRSTVLIKLLDDEGKVTMSWQLSNAWPVKISGTDLKSDSNSVAIDTLEIAHEGITIVR